MPRKQPKIERETPNRVERLGFRLDEETKDLIERAAHLSRRKVSDFCVTALTDTARRTIAEHDTSAIRSRPYGRVKAPSWRSADARSCSCECCERKRRDSSPISRSTSPTIDEKRRASGITRSDLERKTLREKKCVPIFTDEELSAFVLRPRVGWVNGTHDALLAGRESGSGTPEDDNQGRDDAHRVRVQPKT